MKYWDIKKRPCPTAEHHYHIRKFFKNLQHHGGVTLQGAALLVYDEQDPCKSYIVTQQFDPEPPHRLRLKVYNGAEISKGFNLLQRISKALARA